MFRFLKLFRFWGEESTLLYPLRGAVGYRVFSVFNQLGGEPNSVLMHRQIVVPIALQFEKIGAIASSYLSIDTRTAILAIYFHLSLTIL